MYANSPSLLFLFLKSNGKSKKKKRHLCVFLTVIKGEVVILETMDSRKGFLLDFSEPIMQLNAFNCNLDISHTMDVFMMHAHSLEKNLSSIIG